MKISYRNITKQKFALQSPKVIYLRQIGNKGLIKYCENSKFIYKRRKEKEQYTHTQKNNIQRIQNKLSLPSPREFYLK